MFEKRKKKNCSSLFIVNFKRLNELDDFFLLCKLFSTLHLEKETAMDEEEMEELKVI